MDPKEKEEIMKQGRLIDEANEQAAKAKDDEWEKESETICYGYDGPIRREKSFEEENRMYEEQYEAETPFVRLTPENHDLLERENAKGNFYVRKSDLERIKKEHAEEDMKKAKQNFDDNLKKTSFSDHGMEAYLFTATDYQTEIFDEF